MTVRDSLEKLRARDIAGTSNGCNEAVTRDACRSNLSVPIAPRQGTALEQAAMLPNEVNSN